MLAPIFAVLPGDEAVRWGRVFTTLLWFLTALPLYALARRLMASRWYAAAAALLAVLVPWAAVSTVLFSEALAYVTVACWVFARIHRYAVRTVVHTPTQNRIRPGIPSSAAAWM